MPWKGDNRFFAPNFVDWSPAMLCKAIVLKPIAGHMKISNKSIQIPCLLLDCSFSHDTSRSRKKLGSPSWMRPGFRAGSALAIV